ncbi:S8 family serine peptidase [Streptomyces polygonati]|uniref:S8 family serine peptidase n=1 Tax=Streptomyces polygonati TaxID=1617087 RepID=A0ABV8HKP3_9ACTN
MHRSVPPPGRFGRASVALAAVTAAVTASVAVPAAASAPPPASSRAASSPPALSPLAKAASPKPPPKQRQGVVSGQVLVTLTASTSVTGAETAGSRVAARVPDTSSAGLDARLRSAGAVSLRPLLPGLSPDSVNGLVSAARSALGADTSDLARTYVLQTKDKDSAAVARALRGTPGVAAAEPDRYVNTMNSGAQPLPSAVGATRAPAATPPAGRTDASGVPANYALSDSAQAFLNAGGVDAVGAFSLLQGRYGQQPGAGETVTNVSIGDLTDQSMADAGDPYVRSNGPTTVVSEGQRYLDLPSMPLIPTYVAEDAGGLDGAASTENQDASLGEVMLDFGVMAPLPHDRQRPADTGSGYTDLLGIAPGAHYRLVVPEQPTTDRIAGALLAAARQSPRPDVITASLGFGTDAQGFPGRYLEDDPVIRSVVASIVRQDGIVVSISSNDGTRLYTPASVGPDGGSTPTDTAGKAAAATTIDDDAASTTPTEVPDSGAIAAGGTTLDDTLAQGAGGPATTAETRISGFGTFSSGFGSRVDLSAPSDNIVAFSHTAGGAAQEVDASLNGGTSASAPEIAAAAAVVLQAGRLGGHALTPARVRQLLEQTGRAVPTPPQIDRTLHVGPQIDVTAAAEKALGRRTPGGPSLVRLSVAHRVIAGGLGGSFTETTDPDRIDLGDMASGGDGEGLVGPVTFAGDVTGLDGAGAAYTLTVGRTVFRSGSPAIRVTPRQLLAAAGLPVVATADRALTVTYAVVSGGRTVATARRTLTVGPSDGAYAEAAAPKAPAVVSAGHAVTVSYDLSGVAATADPQLVVSGVGHWNPALGPVFSAAWHQSLTAASGTITLPAAAFDGGGGIYGIGIAQSGFGGNPQYISWSEFAPVRVSGGTADQRAAAPLITGGDGVPGHTAEVTRAAPEFTLRYDAGEVRGARSAEVEFSAPAPTVNGSLNTFTDANGSGLDDDGVNTPSTTHRTLPAVSGSIRLDALGLGLSGSEVYDVRVLALDRDHHVIGQASALSTLSVDDGPAPGGSTVLSFATAGSHSVAALRTAAGGTEIRRYDPATGVYGAVIASDGGAGSDYEVLGASADRALVVHQAAPGGDVGVETWNTATGKLVGSGRLPADSYTFVVGRVDAAHDRGALLLRSAADGGDLVLPVDLASGVAGAPIPADPDGVPAGTYSLLDFDTSTGAVYLAKGAPAFLCLGGVTVARVDLVARTVTGAGSTSGCSHGFASDGAGTLYNLSATSISTKIVPGSVLTGLDETSGTQGEPVSLRQQVPVALAVDGVHRLALVSYSSPAGTAYFGSQQGLVLDNNATGQLLLVDLASGTVLRTLTGFSMDSHGGPLVHGGEMNSLQLDPKTRTGWTYAAYDGQIQQFSY